MNEYYVVKEIGGLDGIQITEEAGPFESRADAEQWIGDWNEQLGSQSCGMVVKTSQETDMLFD